MSMVIRRLDTILDSLPTEGRKAAILRGVIYSIREAVDTSSKIVEKIRCVAEVKGYCRENLCNPSCARVYMIVDGDTVRILKHGGNAAGIEVTPTSLRASTKEAAIEVDSTGIVRLRIPGLEEEVNLNDEDSAYKNIYTIRYVLKKVKRAIENINLNLTLCAQRSAVTC